MSHSATIPYVAGMIVFRTIAALFALAVMAGPALVGPAQAQACLDNRQIQEQVGAGQIKSLAAVLSSAGIDSSAEVLSVQVCDEGGRLVYVIGVLAPSGEAQNLVLDAQ